VTARTDLQIGARHISIAKGRTSATCILALFHGLRCITRQNRSGARGSRQPSEDYDEGSPSHFVPLPARRQAAVHFGTGTARGRDPPPFPRPRTGVNVPAWDRGTQWRAA
jgi:hypothetical protein